MATSKIKTLESIKQEDVIMFDTIVLETHKIETRFPKLLIDNYYEYDVVTIEDPIDCTKHYEYVFVRRDIERLDYLKGKLQENIDNINNVISANTILNNMDRDKIINFLFL